MSNRRKQQVSRADLDDCRVLTIEVQHDKDRKKYVVVSKVEKVEGMFRISQPFFDPYETFDIEDCKRFSHAKFGQHAERVANNDDFLSRLKNRYQKYYRDYVPTAGDRPSFRRFAASEELGESLGVTTHNYQEASR